MFVWGGYLSEWNAALSTWVLMLLAVICHQESCRSLVGRRQHSCVRHPWSVCTRLNSVCDWHSGVPCQQWPLNSPAPTCTSLGASVGTYRMQPGWVLGDHSDDIQMPCQHHSNDTQTSHSWCADDRMMECQRQGNDVLLSWWCSTENRLC